MMLSWKYDRFLGGSRFASVLVLSVAAFVPAPLHAQAVDTALVLRTLEQFDASCAAQGRAVWGEPLCGPLVLVHAPTRAAIANMPDPDGRFTPRDGAWFGTLPAGMTTANTAVDWAGAPWAMVLLPLPTDEFDRLALIAHESFHRIQPGLGLAASTAPAPHLDEEAGRLWLRMELRALAAALRADDTDDTRDAVFDALYFRARRHALHPGADTLEAALELHEGLAEYAGAVFAMSRLGVGVEPVLRSIDGFDRRPSFVRSFAYGTGVAIGVLLDRYPGEWRRQAADRPLAELLASVVGWSEPGSTHVAAGTVVERAARYGYVEVAAEEAERARAAAARLADIRARVIDGPVLTLQQETLQASFNPNELVAVPGAGTWYPTGTFRASWGTLEVRGGGALVSGDWQYVRVSAADARAVGRRVAGAGWTLELADGWTARGTPDGGLRLQTGKSQERVEVDLSHHFRALGAEGTFVLHDLAADRVVVYKPKRARQGFLPASTFKILNSLIALETGALRDEHEVIAWDGVDRGDWWNGDQAMTRAFQRSTVWFYQEVARRIGEARMREWVRRVGYGNADIGGGIDRFWLEGDLRISAEGQVDLLRRLHSDSLPFSERSQEIVRRVMLMEEAEGYVLRGKTGWARQPGVDTILHTGWLVGWVEREGRTYVFATQIESSDQDFPMRRAQQEITRGALSELGVLP
jgi:beta-lactamase class D